MFLQTFQWQRHQQDDCILQKMRQEYAEKGYELAYNMDLADDKPVSEQQAQMQNTKLQIILQMNLKNRSYRCDKGSCYC